MSSRADRVMEADDQSMDKYDDTMIGAMTGVDLEFTPRTADFVLSVLEHPVTREALYRCIEQETIVFPEEDQRPNIVPDPLGRVRSVSTMGVYRWPCWDTNSVALAWLMSIYKVAEADEHIPEGLLSCSENIGKVADALIGTFFTDAGDAIHRLDAIKVHQMLLHHALQLCDGTRGERQHLAQFMNQATFGNAPRLLVYRRNDPCVCGSGKKYKKCCRRAREG